MRKNKLESRFKGLSSPAGIVALLSSGFYLILALLLIAAASFNIFSSVEISPSGGFLAGLILVLLGLPGLLGAFMKRRRRLFLWISGGLNALMIPLFPLLLPLPIGFPAAAALIGASGIVILNAASQIGGAEG